MYRTCNQDYNPQSYMKGESIPSFKEIGNSILDHTKLLKLYKN